MLLTVKPDNIEQEQWNKEIAEIKNEISSYLLSALSGIEDIREIEQMVTVLSQNTLGYFQLQTEEQKNVLTNIFLRIGKEIITRIPDLNQRLIFSKSILSLNMSEYLINFIQTRNQEIIDVIDDETAILKIFWPVLYEFSSNNILKSFTEENSLSLCERWINGDSFPLIFDAAKEMSRNNNYELRIENIVDLCEGGLSYNVSTILGSISELCTLAVQEDYLPTILLKLSVLQKRLKYGVPGLMESSVYELGFSDRILTMEISALIGESSGNIKSDIKSNEAIRLNIETNYPDYFLLRYNNLSTQ